MERIQTHLKVGSSCRIESKIYFCNITFNGIFYLDLEDYSIHFVHKFSYEPDHAVRLSKDNSLVYGNAIYFFPNYTNIILKYDILTGREKAIPIPDFPDKFVDISGIARLQDTVYLFPAKLGKGIYAFDLQSEQVKKDTVLSSLFDVDFVSTSGHIFYDDKGCVWIGRYGSGQIVKVNLAEKRIEDNKVLEGIRIFIMCFDGSHCWILPIESTDIYEWDVEKDDVQIYTNGHMEWRKVDHTEEKPYSNLIFLEDEILVLNCYAKNIWRLDKQKKIIGDPVEFPKGFGMANRQFNGWPVYAQYTMLEDKVLLYPCAGNMLLIYDKNTKKMSGKDLLVSEEDVPYLRKALKGNLTGERQCFEDGDFATLERFLEEIEINDEKKEIREKGNTGRIIYQKCYGKKKGLKI